MPGIELKKVRYRLVVKKRIFLMYREIDLSLEDEFKLKEHVNLLVTLDKHQLIENSMESKLSQLDFERIIKCHRINYPIKTKEKKTKSIRSSEKK